MKYLLHTLVLGLFITAMSACQHQGPVQESVDSPLVGQWAMHGDQAEVHLIVRPDYTFHVDVLAEEGIEVEGKYELDQVAQEITFINLEGTDPVSSDPHPGTYAYSIEGNNVHFERVNDRLDRRAGFLTQGWERVE